MNFSIYHMVCAALLHDIGKLIQRTGAADLSDSRYTSKCRESTVGKYLTHKHVMWSTEFLDKYRLPIEDWDSIADIAGSHHNSGALIQTNYSRYLEYLKSADHIASHWDREAAEEDISGSYRYRKTPLYSIFDTISTRDNKAASERKHYYLPQPKAPETVLDMQTDFALRDMQPEYQTLYQGFLAEYIVLHQYYQAIAAQQPQAFTKDYFPLFLDALDSLLEKYLWYVPANTTEPKPICSLYHHVRNVACIASTLYAANEVYQIDTGKEKDSKPFMLIGCDLNGIQSYLYDLNPENSQKSAKLLRARSFQIKAVLDMIGQWIIDDLQLSRFSILSNTAGKLIILAPCHPDVVGKLIGIKQKIEQEVFQRFLGMLSLNLNWDTQIGLYDLDKEHFLATLETCLKAMEKEKLHRFQTCLTDAAGWKTDSFVINKTPVYNDSICPYCKRRLASVSTDKGAACHECYEEIKLGELLVKKHLMRIAKSAADSRHTLLRLGEYILETLDDAVSPVIYPDSYYFDIRPETRQPLLFAVKPTASVVPLDSKGKLKDFAEIAASAQGVEANAIVKGDVDDLGKLFQDGLKRKAANGKMVCSITEYSAFSSLLDYFFSVVVPQMIATNYPDSIYTVYSGGDDFCLVGAWEKVVEFTRELQKAFAIYTAANPEIHFCAAICLLHPKAPIRFAILDTEEQLKNAKQLEPGEKNRLYLFETIVKWSETSELFTFAEQISAWLNKDTGVTTQFLYRLLAYHEMYLQTQQCEHALHNHLYDALLQYDIKRNLDQHRKQEKLSDSEINQLRSISAIGKKSILPKLRIPVCYTLYKNRKHGG